MFGVALWCGGGGGSAKGNERNEIAPSEKKWNEFVYQYSLGGKVQERGVASEDSEPSSSVSK